MFTGIVQAVGQVSELRQSTLRVMVAHEFAPEGYDQGESISVNGCCLTVISDLGGLTFDVSPETFRRTALGSLRAGDPVNLERAMAANGRFGGHIVQGHVDDTGTILSIESEGEFVVVQIAVDPLSDRYFIDKGSVTIDGISLTVVDPSPGQFTVWLVPHTLNHTNLRSKTPGEKVNIEFDVIAKYVEKLLKVH